MTYLLIKATLSGVIVLVVSEVARRGPGIGGLIASLPLVSIIAMIWLWRDTGDVERISRHSESTFWFVLPTLPMFLMLPVLLRHGTSFWMALGACVVLTVSLYAAVIWLLPKLGVSV